MKKIILSLALISTISFVNAQKTKKEKEAVAHHLDIPIYIPFTDNNIVNQYMSDYKSLLNLFDFVYDNHQEKVLEQNSMNNTYSLTTNMP